MDDNQKAIQNIKQALRQLATNGVPVGNMIEAMKEIEEKYAESEDEKIRKWLVEEIYKSVNSSINKGFDIDMGGKALAWLEKQGEKKPTDEEMIALLRTEYEKGRADAIAEMQKPWGEEDEEHIESILKRLDGMCQKGATFTRTRFAVSEDKDWLKSLKERVQPKQELSEEDREMRMKVLKYLSTRCNVFEYEEVENWLKSLRPQNTWKPSDKQIEAVRIAAEIGTANDSWAMGILKDMYQDLKKLKD